MKITYRNIKDVTVNGKQDYLIEEHIIDADEFVIRYTGKDSYTLEAFYLNKGLFKRKHYLEVDKNKSVYLEVDGEVYWNNKKTLAI